MDEPPAVKESDTTLRLSTDLPHFNWLQNKLTNGSQPQSHSIKPDHNLTQATALPIPTVQETILQVETSVIEKATVSPTSMTHKATVLRDELVSAQTVSSMPLKKRLIRRDTTASVMKESPTTPPLAQPTM